MEEKQRNKVGYYSVIPSKILYNKELKAMNSLTGGNAGWYSGGIA